MGEDFDPIILRVLMEMDAEQIAAFRATMERLQREVGQAAERTARVWANRTEAVFKASLKAMDRENATHNAKRQEQDKAAAAKEVEQKKILGRQQVQADEHRYKEARNLSRLAHEQELELGKIHGRKQVADRVKENKEILEKQAQANRHRLENHRQANREEQALVQGQVKRVLEDQAQANRHRLENHKQANRKLLEADRQANRETIATLNGDIKSRLQKEAAANRERLSAQNAAQRRQQTILEAGIHRQNQIQAAALEKQVDSHKAMWAVIRTVTETGGRFMSSITQSALRSMGNAVGYGMRGILSQFKRGGDKNEAALRSSYEQQEAITRRGLAQQQGAIASFQQRAQRGVIGSLFNLRNVLAGAGVYLGARAIFGPVMEYEQTQVAFENLLGSAQKAETLLADLRRFNVATPFELPQIQNAAKQLLAMGETMNEIVPDLTAIGDVGAKFSASSEDVNGVIRALGQMSQSAKVSAQDINQIQQRFVGFNARAAIARGLGISVAEAMEKIADGSISGNEGMNAMIEGMKSEANAAGAMKEQMETLTGRLSNFKDLLTRILLDVMVPLLPMMQSVVEQITLFIDQLVYGNGIFAVARSVLLGVGIALGLIVAQEAAGAVLDAVGQSLKLIAANPLTALLAAVTVLGVTLYRHNDDFRAFVDGFLLKVRDFVKDYAEPVRRALVFIGTGIAGIASAIMEADWSGATERLGNFVSDIRTMLEPATDFLVEFGTDAFQKWQDWLDGGGLGDLGDSIKWRILDALVKVKEGVEAIDWEMLMRPAMAAAGVAIAGLILGWPGVIGAALVAGLLLLSPRVSEGVGELFGRAQEWITEAWSGIDWGAVALTVLEGIRQIGEFVGGPVMQTIFSDTGLKIMGGIAVGLVAAAGALALGLAQGLKESLPIVWGNLGDIIKGGMHTLSEKVKDTPLGPIISAFTETFSRAFDAVAGELDFLSAIIDAMTGDGDWGDAVDKGVEAFLGWWRLVMSAPQLVRGMSETFNMLLTEALGGASSAVTEWARGLEGRFGDFVQIATAPWAFIVGIVSDILDRIRDFVRGWIDVIAGFFSGDFSRVFEGVKGIWGSLFGFIRDVIGRFQTFMWSVLSGLGSLIWQNVTGGLSWVKEKFFEWGLGILGWFEGLPGKIARAFGNLGTKILNKIKDGIGGASGFAGDIVDAVKGYINTEIIDRLNGLLEFEFDTHIPGVGVVHLDAPDIPHLAKGGIVTRPTVALIGEAGPEAVIPLSDGAGSIPFSISFDAAAIAGQVDAVVALIAPMGERLIEATMPGMRLWASAIDRILGRILVGFKTWGDDMVSLSTRIATAIVDGITAGLREGKSEVTQIVRGYSRSVVGALNPLLTGVGEPAITLAFARGGIAEAHQGAQVHVFNEGKRGQGSSHGEAYIPFDPTNRPRSRHLADETVRRLGGNVQWFANGGITASQVQPGASIPGVTGDIVGLVTEFARRLSSWSLANGGGYNVNSGYRSMDEQARLYRNYLAGVPGQAQAAPPGSSLHNFGLASDGNHWRDRNPAMFGLTFPMSFEPWHVQPVEGRGLVGGDAFPTFDPIPQPPSAGGRGWFSRTARAAMRHAYDKVLGYASNLSMSQSVGPLIPSTAAAIVAELQKQATPRGWNTGANWSGLTNLVDHESGWNPNAQNPRSTAYGLFQFLNGTWAGTGIAKTANYILQITAGLRYIASRYQNPANAWNYWQAHRSYSYGGVTDRDQVAYLHRNEVVLPLSNQTRLADLLRRTGLDSVIAESLGTGTNLGVPDLSAASRSASSSAPSIGEVNYTQVIHTAGNERTTARLVKRDTDKALRSALIGVG